jgi:hypothetical protein
MCSGEPRPFCRGCEEERHMRALAALALIALFTGACEPSPAQPSASICTYAFTPPAIAVGLQGGTASLGISTTAGCSWEVRTEATWITISGAADGTGPGSVTLEISQNTGAANRGTTLSIGHGLVVVSQIGTEACAYQVSPTEFTPCMWSSAGSVQVTVANGCPWTATVAEPWIIVDSGNAGSGVGTVAFHATENYAPPRDAVIQVRWPTPSAGQNVRIEQAGCLYAVDPVSAVMPAAGADAYFQVRQMALPGECGGPTQDRCLWTAQPDKPWISIVSSPGRGDERVYFRVAANDSSASRSGTITVQDQQFQITQMGR